MLFSVTQTGRTVVLDHPVQTRPAVCMVISAAETGAASDQSCSVTRWTTVATCQTSSAADTAVSHTSQAFILFVCLFGFNVA